MVDPRISVVNERLKNIENIVAVSSGKGGVGKSLVASTLALTLAKKGCKTGLFDLDFTSPSTHLILGVQEMQPKEEKGIIPPEVYGLKYMSIVYYSGNQVTPLRGADVSNALIELLAITRWEKLDFLVVDMPPGIGDATLDLLRLVKNVKFLVITTPSRLAFETVRKLVSLLRGLEIPIVGIVENMKMDDSKFIQTQVKNLGLPFLGEIPFDNKIEDAIGNVDKLLETVFAKKVESIAAKL
ncbi:ATP-binding protein [Candidatus Bathyarchaeota archaeon]|nr:MAG: ATP-binding protein [Candidatus Bathyarchaeota archaeon]RJS82223.1 MAG: ATP-binding protein [Candidatus Bathyarchaeota archaeon]RLI18544.1 MAG: ATP-binding protein [Candidatus Bathyarchaeota archaeon]